jgi:hypothetical protein
MMPSSGSTGSSGHYETEKENPEDWMKSAIAWSEMRLSMSYQRDTLQESVFIYTAARQEQRCALLQLSKRLQAGQIQQFDQINYALM